MIDFDYSDETMIVVEELYRYMGLTEVLIGYDKLAHQFFTMKIIYEPDDLFVRKPVYYYETISDNHYTELTGYETPNDSYDSEAIEVMRSPGSMHFDLSRGPKTAPYKANVIPPNHGRLIISSNTHEIRYGKYFNRKDLLEINISMGVKRIGETAFYGCDRITDIFLPESIEEIGPKAFMYCTRLKSVRMPNHVVKTHYNAFSGCNSLTDVFLSKDYINAGMLNPKNDSFKNAWFNSYETRVIHFHIMDGTNELFCLIGTKSSLSNEVNIIKT